MPEEDPLKKLLDIKLKMLLHEKEVYVRFDDVLELLDLFREYRNDKARRQIEYISNN